MSEQQTLQDRVPPLPTWSTGRERRLLLSICCFAACWPVWRWYGLRLNDGSDEPLGLLALLSAAFLLWPHRSRLSASTAGTLGAAALLLTYSLLFPLLLPLPRAVLGLIALGLASGLQRAPAGVWGLLILSLPLMASLQFFLNHPLQKITAQGASTLINLWPGVEVTVRGTLLQWQGQPVAVDPPCSGIKMLWVGGFAHFALAAFHRHSWKTLTWLSPVALLGIVAANSLRAALLFPKESGAIPLPEWTHAGIGLVVFGGALAVMTWGYARLAKPACMETRRVQLTPNSTSSFARTSLLTAALLAAVTPMLLRQSTASPTIAEFPGWPDEFEDRALTERPLSKHEQAFAEDFPGRLATFDDSGGRRIILRWVTAPTRKLHSSADCLRAAGCTISASEDSGEWRRIVIQDGEYELVARERIFSQSNPGLIWSDVSSWFWAAGKNPDSGPWWAVTVIEASASAAHSTSPAG